MGKLQEFTQKKTEKFGYIGRMSFSNHHSSKNFAKAHRAQDQDLDPGLLGVVQTWRKSTIYSDGFPIDGWMD